MKKVLLVIATLLLFATGVTPAAAATQTSSLVNPEITAKSALAIDSETGQVLYEKHADQVLPIASMSKVLSAYLIMKSVQSGKMRWDQPVKINADIAKISENSELTNVPLTAGKSYTIKNLLDASLIYSANAAIIALGKAQAGSLRKFVDEMRATVRSWGIKDAKLYNAAGLLENQVGAEKYPNSPKNAENQMSANDMAVVIQHVLKEFPEILQITKIQKLDFDTGSGKVTMINHNELLPGGAQYDNRYQLDGLKTGTSLAAGEDFAATGKVNQRRIISVVLGAKTDHRFTDTKAIWQALMTNLTVVKTNLKNQASVVMDSAKQRQVKLRLAQPLAYWKAKKGGQMPKLDQVKLKATKTKAPVDKNQVIATGRLTGASLSFLPNKSARKVQLKPVHDVQKASWWVRLGRTISGWFH
ncbi:serine hydrolase [Pediococcus acidilactici]|uniref:serine hydrolase n=1 Tax=Pediococcus acidilactici TaxID=1254 RepID=UPI0013261FB9|nr:serine hydrolase [Pediococcus acidilactici]KAF0334905.1 serine hydrolase [Pediococcus acidilactici]KAF0347856.1 serine hydrolase [Pediococcus acidilactici]KAF0394383.1 serine hydrolase [Pediococcus acidilactici]KAF0397605.1 serine hydrolase [Pediococcus acidilactici]KAF0411089.1 serine hydrolase [Pediococcus acidilactici]